MVDGDTIRVSLRGQTVTVRYIGMDTPETVAPGQPVARFGAEATAANKSLVEGKTVQLEKDVSETDSFGRLLRYVYVTDFTGERMVNAELVRLGFARVATYPPDVKHQGVFVELERQARAADAGLWAAEAPRPTPTPSLDPTASRLPTLAPSVISTFPPPTLDPTVTRLPTLAPAPLVVSTFPPPAPALTPVPTPVPTAPPAPGFDPRNYIGQGDRYNCGDFGSQADAQAVLRAAPSDPNRLDTDRDGIACESNRNPKDLVPVPR